MYVNKEMTNKALDELCAAMKRKLTLRDTPEWVKDCLVNASSNGALAESIFGLMYETTQEFKRVNEKIDTYFTSGREHQAKRIFEEEWMPLNKLQSRREHRLVGMGIEPATIMEYYREQEVENA